MGEHPIHQQITDILRQHNCWFEEFTHPPVRTSEEAAALRDGYTLQQGAKAIIIRAKIPNEGKKFVMLVMPADQKFDSAKVKQVLSCKDIRFATDEEVEEITKGVKPGGVPPFGNLFGLEVISDKSLYDNEKIVFNAGRTSSIAMRAADYQKLVTPKIAEII
ncbi:MAG TPA: YbaK/EbsC family protein [Candidatus Saccharimonadales bacterium]|nr:YbaK/EbsC family protein [Candidatus Saccharimonadales bacterium]